MNIQITKREMTQNDRYLYSQSRAARILGVKEVEFVYVCSDKNILVGLFNDSVHLTANDFKVAYANERKLRGTGFKVTQRLDKEHTYTVRNEKKDSTYKVETFADKIECSCPDFEMTKSVMKSDKVACKHVYAVLGVLGYDSLQTYLKGNIQQIAI